MSDDDDYDSSGVFAKSPDSHVFGPDKLAFKYAGIMQKLHPNDKSDFYVAPYRSDDYPDLK